MIKLVATAGFLWFCVGCAAMAQQGPARTPEEASLLAADARQLSAVAAADAAAIDSLSHPNLRVHAPNRRIVTKEEFLQAVGSGQIRDEVAERTPESVTITGDIGVVMGRETTLLKAGSEQAARPGTTRINRRYTNIYLRVNGAWLHLARHANVVRE
jgi:hypothetical protein